MEEEIAYLPISYEGKIRNFAVHETDKVVELYGKDIVRLLSQYSDDERMRIFSHFCKSCGSKTLPCHCWNDE